MNMSFKKARGFYYGIPWLNIVLPERKALLERVVQALECATSFPNRRLICYGEVLYSCFRTKSLLDRNSAKYVVPNIVQKQLLVQV